jgi:tyrosine aminotransferase
VVAVGDILESYQANGYTDSQGPEAARAAVAKLYSSEECEMTTSDVVLANGASGALRLIIAALCSEGSNILVPRRGFTYSLAAPQGVECRYYDCLVCLLICRVDD